MSRVAAAAVLLALLAAAPENAASRSAFAGEEAPTQAEALLARVGPAVVSIRFNVAATASRGGQSGSLSVRTQARGVLVDAGGLVLTSDTRTGGPNSPLRKHALGSFPGLNLKVDIEDLQVVLGDGEELPAVVVVRDGRNDLAWLQVVGLGERRLPTVDLAGAREPRLGEVAACVNRVGRGFGYALAYARRRVGAVTESPRRSWNLGSTSGHAGLLWFDGTGAPLGVMAFVATAEGTDTDEPSLRLLPMDVVKRSLEAARKRVPDALEKAQPKAPEAGH